LEEEKVLGAQLKWIQARKKGGNIPTPLVMMNSSLLFHVIALFIMIG
jgi:hypothetical protein